VLRTGVKKMGMGQLSMGSVLANILRAASRPRGKKKDKKRTGFLTMRKYGLVELKML